MRKRTTTSFTKSGKLNRTIEPIRIERQYANVIRLFLAGELPHFTHQRHVDVGNFLHFVPDKCSAEITDRHCDQLDGTLPDPFASNDLPGGASGTR